jgi:hypothetical protein
MTLVEYACLMLNGEAAAVKGERVMGNGPDEGMRRGARIWSILS